MAKLLSFGLNILADLFYPKYCFGCKRAGSYLCKFCITQIPIIHRGICIMCRKSSENGKTHENCKTPFSPDGIISILPYKNSIVSDMIVTGKYYFIPEVFAILGAIVAQELLQKGLEEKFLNFVVCPIPLHIQRLRWRGFNQSAIAAKILSEGLHITYIELLKRLRKTRTQKDLNADERKINMLNAFSCFKEIPEKILLIDDVTTTGQTLSEATKVLKKNGAKTVWCISLAKD